MKLAAAYQSMARANALVAVANVVKVQNHMFTSAMGQALAATQQIATTWGQDPILPPGSGISLEFTDFAQQTDAISSQQAASDLVRQLEYASTGWDLLDAQLVTLKKTIIG